MHLFLSSDVFPFAVCAIILVCLTGIEIICLLVGFSLSHVVEKAWPHDHAGPTGLLSWLNVGGVPILILLMLMLGTFSIAGFVLQILVAAIFAPLPVMVACVAAFPASLYITRASSRLVAKIVPRDESYAVQLSDFIGRSGEVTVGPLDQALPGRVRVKDQYGNWHLLRARAAPSEKAIAIGTPVLIVDRVSDIFLAIPAPVDITALLTP